MANGFTAGIRVCIAEPQGRSRLWWSLPFCHIGRHILWLSLGQGWRRAVGLPPWAGLQAEVKAFSPPAPPRWTMGGVTSVFAGPELLSLCGCNGRTLLGEPDLASCLNSAFLFVNQLEESPFPDLKYSWCPRRESQKWRNSRAPKLQTTVEMSSLSHLLPLL